VSVDIDTSTAEWRPFHSEECKSGSAKLREHCHCVPNYRWFLSR